MRELWFIIVIRISISTKLHGSDACQAPLINVIALVCIHHDCLHKCPSNANGDVLRVQARVVLTMHVQAVHPLTIDRTLC